MRWIILILIIIALFYIFVFRDPTSATYLWIKSLITVPSPTITPIYQDVDVCSCSGSNVIENKCAAIHNAICTDERNCICE